MKNLILILSVCFAVLLSGCSKFKSASPEGSSSLSSTTADKSDFQWTVGSWGACSATACGTSGTQMRSVTCTKNSSLFDDSKCSDPKPLDSQVCSALACVYTYSWVVGAWSACSATACGTNGVQSRSVVCTRNDGVASADSNCTASKPATSQACAAMVCVYTYSWVVGAWSACSATACGTNGVQSRSVVCTRNDGLASADSNCTASKPATTQACAAAACPPGTFIPPVRNVGPTVVSVKSYGALGNGVHDDTAAFQAAINALPSAGGTVTVPAGNYPIDATKSIKLRSYLHLDMDPNAVLKEEANSLDNSRLMVGDVVHDVEISGGQLIGDRDIHMGTTGESGMGISFHGGVRVTIRNVVLSKFWGDGVYIGAWQRSPVVYSSDVVLYQTLSTQNRRQGLSITNAENVKVYNCEFSYTKGTPPQYGIDIEPNQIATKDNNTRYAKNIEIVECKIHHNEGGGIQFYRQVYNAQIKSNDISYNYGTGLYAIESFDSSIESNLFSHNEQKGLSFHTDTNNISVSSNIFRNNYTAQLGLTNDTNSLVTITGLQSGTGGNGTTSHIGIMPDAKVINILTNQYAK